MVSSNDNNSSVLEYITKKGFLNIPIPDTSVPAINNLMKWNELSYASKVSRDFGDYTPPSFETFAKF